jgi:hypothetical protein
MNINPAAAAAVAGVSRAAAQGGEADCRAAEASNQQAKAEAPAGKTNETTVAAGDQTQDRGGDGRQLLDVFERHDEKPPSDEAATEQSSDTKPAPPEGHIDLQA